MPAPDFSAAPSGERGTGVRLEGISKRFGKVTVFDGVGLEVSAGELFSLVGPSGSGKTTLLRIIAGLETQDKGHVYIGGKAVDALGPAKRNVGMVFQDYALYPNKTVMENITSPLLVKGVKKADAVKEATEMAELLGIGETVDRRPGQVSGGQQQRVALARALVKKPDVFLLDEPFSNLDAQLRFSSRKFLKDVQRRFGITTIYVTHDQSEALSISDRVAIVGKGEVHQVGTPKEIYASPADEFTATFIGSPPLNVLTVAVANGASSPLFIPVDGMKDGEYRVGIRPESMTLGSGPNGAEVTALEFAGRETVVYLKVGGVEVRSIVQEAGGLQIGQKVRFAVLPGAVRVLAGGSR
ncbi:MAG: ABC transporter ATP-binding protein [Nitrososphaerota archaeon]|nr:ABC transporter ATP-binding protein [Nitrososphaerota archaeon]